MVRHALTLGSGAIEPSLPRVQAHALDSSIEEWTRPALLHHVLTPVKKFHTTQVLHVFFTPEIRYSLQKKTISLLFLRGLKPHYYCYSAISGLVMYHDNLDHRGATAHVRARQMFTLSLHTAPWKRSRSACPSHPARRRSLLPPAAATVRTRSRRSSPTTESHVLI